MKCSILAVIVGSVLTLGAAHAQELQAVPNTPATTTGAPGTATPTPYPQVTPPTAPKPQGTGAPLLPPIEMPKPPKDQTLPGLQQNDSKPKAPAAGS
ncbi:hypothetical protein H097_26513 [Pseudomonas sp. FH4]|uniref:Uncharacterized protein n=1 Tax=Pseudomonas brenneri TaxID=129817 RepID=A0A5B2UMZ3_9PSED|nr:MULTISPECIES: hypothetical protein [Pseudomonas]KAA6167222.1 hypothetical protein F3K50_25235 [Pseudomonas marginalis]ETK14050.1 hypothetical protein H097_26513 [Pseudomonas sp. FH4]KAA2227908.1 hypothetical protein F1720_20135 [Pseudomonas brenneri]MBF8007710.1 hypothetical protein [Pseudomonas brenneri]TWR78682.1 hypothetical protein FJD34_12595 [Pseudomonas brenneri]